MYTSERGTHGIIVHKRSSDLAMLAPGRQGVPMSFYFRDDEEIVTIGLVATDSDFGPFLMVRHCPSFILDIALEM